MTDTTPPQPSETEDSILGLSTTQLAGLTVDELLDNKTAIMMMMHYYKQLVAENTGLRNEGNTLRTYAEGYERKRTYASIGAGLLAASNILVGFGVNLLTSGSNWPGGLLLLAGIVQIAMGLGYTAKE
jgi:hypothetical protein